MMISRNRCVRLLIGIIFLVGSRSFAAVTDAETSEYLKTVTGGIAVENDNKRVFYAVFLDVIKPFGQDVYLKTEFQNPCDFQKPLVETQVVKSTQTIVTVKSENVACLEKGKVYLVEIAMFSDSEMKKVFSKHEQWVLSGVNDKMVKEMFHEYAVENESRKKPSK